jgi:hypothetical protein
MNGNRRSLHALLAALAALALVPTAGMAQQPVDSRWLPWLGCWQPGAEQESPQGDLLVCVRPSGASDAVEITTVRNGEVTSTRTLVADAQPHAVQDQSCSGSQFAQFSSDARRVYLWSTLACEGGLKRTASAIMALSSPREWLDAQALGVNGKRAPRVMHYRSAADSLWPTGFELSAQRAEAVADARVAASGRLSLADVQEAASRVDQEALAAFVLEWDRPFDLNAGKLAVLADAGVPADVIDAVVAVSYPTRFVIDRGAGTLALAPTPERERRYSGRDIYADPYGWGWWGMDQCFGSWGYWTPYCGSSLYWASGFGLGGYLPYWYNPYGYGYGYVGQPIIVVPNGNGRPAHGTLVPGRGYTGGGQPVGGTGDYAHRRGSATQSRRGGDYAPPAASSPPRSSGASPSAGSSSGSVSPGGYTRSSPPASGSTSQGTAKPKCCS